MFNSTHGKKNLFDACWCKIDRFNSRWQLWCTEWYQLNIYNNILIIRYDLWPFNESKYAKLIVKVPYYTTQSKSSLDKHSKTPNLKAQWCVLLELLPHLFTEAVTLAKRWTHPTASWEYFTHRRQAACQSLLSHNDVEFVNLSRRNSTNKSKYTLVPPWVHNVSFTCSCAKKSLNIDLFQSPNSVSRC